MQGPVMWKLYFSPQGYPLPPPFEDQIYIQSFPFIWYAIICQAFPKLKKRKMSAFWLANSNAVKSSVGVHVERYTSPLWPVSVSCFSSVHVYKGRWKDDGLSLSILVLMPTFWLQIMNNWSFAHKPKICRHFKDRFGNKAKRNSL